MAPTRPRPPQLAFLALLSALRFCTAASAALETVAFGDEIPEITCSKGLTDCQAQKVNPSFEPNDLVDIIDVKPKVILCCFDPRDCKPCLQINITIQVENGVDVSGESELRSDEEEFSGKPEVAERSVPRSLVVHLSEATRAETFTKIKFTPLYASSHEAPQPPKHTLQLLLKNPLMFGNVVDVDIKTHIKRNNINQTITVPSLDQVCSTMTGSIKQCDTPTVAVVPDYKRSRVILKLVDAQNRQDDFMFHMKPPLDLTWPKGREEMVIPSDLVVPCLCFEVWWRESEIHKSYCPFRERREAHERMQRNVSVTMVQFVMEGGDTGLSWNVTAPCQLEAELWLCKKDVTGGPCEVVRDSRQTLHSQGNWRTTGGGYWSKSGDFKAQSHPLYCIQMKINTTILEPHCPFAKSRWRWSLPVLIVLLLMCLAILGAYFIQGVLKGYVWRWLKEDDVKGAVGGGHVVLLYPPDDDKALPGLMCHLGSSLQALGFSVSLDLWSQTELGALGPVPWLHSRLDQLKRQGGKVVLVLTQEAWIRAEEWGARGPERNIPSQKNRDTEEDKADNGYLQSPALPCVDVFSASLSCILADYLQGRAGERFTLVQFESLPPEPPGGFRPIPELFRGLHLYSLPSQSLGFLTELAGARQVATASARRKRAWGLRKASRALASGLSSFTAGTTVLRLAGMSQSCVRVRAEDSGETVPLQPCILTPPSSPDISPKVNEVDWL